MNKTLKKTLSIILAVLMIATTVPFAFAADVSLVINMTDSYGDGWNGNAIQVGTVSGGEFTKIADATFNDGATATYETVISDESIYAFRWTVSSYREECSFKILIGGETVFETSDCSSYADNDYIYIWCNHSFDDSICSACGLECGVDFAHTMDSDAKCTACGYICDHSYTNHYCKACGTAESGYYAGACGADNVNDAIWSLDSEGTLTISGTGKYDVEYLHAPWLAYKDSIKDVVIEKGITNIAVTSFHDLNNAVSLSIPSTVNEIDNYYNNYFAEFKLAEGNSSFTLVDGVLFNADKTELLMYPAKKAEETYTVPVGVTTLCEYSFHSAKNLKTINISDDVTTIGYDCFYSSSLETVNFGANVDSIESDAFSYTRLKTVVLPEKLTEIPYSLFYVCSYLENLVIGSNVTSIDEDVIAHCDKLEAVHFTGTEEQWDAIAKPTYTEDAINTIAVHCGTFDEKDGFAATCGADGHTAGLYCTECDDYVSGEVIPATGEHPSYENGICTVCFNECEHDTDNGDCSICGKYMYAITHQPTADEPYVELNEDEGATYQWYTVEGDVVEITDENASGDWQSLGAPFNNSVYEDGKWTADNFADIQYYFMVDLEAGDTINFEFASEVEAIIFGIVGDPSGYFEVGDTKYSITVEETGTYWLMTPPVDYVRAYTGSGSTYTAIDGETAAELKNPEFGKKYACEVTFKDGTKEMSDAFEYTYAITHQPTEEEPYVELNDDTDATYQWYIVKENKTEITNENASTVSYDWGESSYDEETGWTGVPFEEGYSGQDFFTVALEAGKTVAVEVTGDFADGLGLWDYDTQNDAWVGAEEGVTSYELTVEKDGNYTFYTYVNSSVVTVKATVTKTNYTAIEGQTAATLIPTELGKYACEVTFADGTKEMSDIFEVTHLCDFSGEWKSDGSKHWKECTCGDIAEEGEHSWIFGKCTECGYACEHDFTNYEETEAPKCGVAGKEVAGCNNDCGATDEKEIPALTHTDADGDYLCDHGCGHEFEKPAEPDTPDEPTDDTCDHMCHKDGILGFFWKIFSFFFRLFNIQQYCDCGVIHYEKAIFG